MRPTDRPTSVYGIPQLIGLKHCKSRDGIFFTQVSFSLALQQHLSSPSHFGLGLPYVWIYAENKECGFNKIKILLNGFKEIFPMGRCSNGGDTAEREPCVCVRFIFANKNMPRIRARKKLLIFIPRVATSRRSSLHEWMQYYSTICVAYRTPATSVKKWAVQRVAFIHNFFLSSSSSCIYGGRTLESLARWYRVTPQSRNEVRRETQTI